MTKRVILLFPILLTGWMACAQEPMKPKDTEAWEPVPPKVKPGIFASPPSDAIVLLGNDWSEWNGLKDSEYNWNEPKLIEPGWDLVEGVATVKPGAGHIISKKGFGSMQLHIEWRAPLMTVGEGQDRGNSGIFLMQNYEVQVLDSYSSTTYSNGQAGSIYKQSIPLVNASRPPLEWQSYDIIFTAPVFAGETLVSPAYVTVLHNGVLIQNNVEIKGFTRFIGNPEYRAHPVKLPIVLQDHGNMVSFRNIWVRELD